MAPDTERSSEPDSERPSQVPGFDMTYRPEECSFGPPLRKRVPSLLYLGLALFVVALLVVGEMSGSTTQLFDYVVVQDAARAMSLRTLAIILSVGAFASVLRSGMHGVRIHADGVETREIQHFFIPRVRRYKWAQLEGVILDLKRTVALDLWNGRREFLPVVGNRAKLVQALERVAVARAIPVRGGSAAVETFGETASK